MDEGGISMCGPDMSLRQERGEWMEKTSRQKG